MPGTQLASSVATDVLGGGTLCLVDTQCTVSDISNIDMGLQPHCVESGVPLCNVGVGMGRGVRASDATGGFTATVINALAWDRSDIITIGLPVHGAASLAVTDRTGARVPAQVAPINSTYTAVTFRASVPALGFASYTVAPAPTPPPPPTTPTPPQEPFSLANSRLKLDFDGAGRLTTVTNLEHTPPLVTTVTMAVKWYVQARPLHQAVAWDLPLRPVGRCRCCRCCHCCHC